MKWGDRKFVIVKPEIFEKPITDKYDKDLALDFGKTKLEYSTSKAVYFGGYPYWEKTKEIFGIVLEERENSKIVYLWSSDDNSYKDTSPSVDFLNYVEDLNMRKGYTNFITGLTIEVSNKYIKNISFEAFNKKVFKEKLNIYYHLNRNDNLKVRNYMSENRKLIKLAYMLSLFGKEELKISNEQFLSEQNIGRTFFDSPKSYKAEVNSENIYDLFSDEFLLEFFVYEDFILPVYGPLTNIFEDYIFDQDDVFESVAERSNLNDVFPYLRNAIHSLEINPSYEYWKGSNPDINFVIKFFHPDESYFSKEFTNEEQNEIIAYFEDVLKEVKERIKSKNLTIDFGSWLFL